MACFWRQKPMAPMNKQTQISTPAEHHGRCRLRNDLIFIFALLILVSMIGAGMYLFRGEGDTVRVTVDGVLYGTYPLSEDTRIEIRTGTEAEYINVLVIRDGKAYVEEANCPDGICVSHRSVSRDGESIACLPHRVAIVVYTRESHADIVV